MMNSILIISICSLLLNIMGSNHSIDLQGKTYRVAAGDVSLFDGREIHNGTLVISKGDYLLRVPKEGGSCLRIGDNTELIIDGNLRLASNSFKKYNMICVVGNHVKINGKGCVIGDRQTHTGSEGEWGMGINFQNASHATLSGLTIKDCWGDCVYVGKKSTDILIRDCLLDNSRRQGVSVTSANRVTIRNCKITNISGTYPQYGIDIEPNKKCTIDNVVIENVEVKNCEGGIRAALPNAGIGNAMIGRVAIRNCFVSAKTRYPIHLKRCRQALVEHCVIDATNDKPGIFSKYVDKLRVYGNTLHVDVKLLSSLVNMVKKRGGKGAYSPIQTVKSGSEMIENNKIIEK